MGKNVSLEIATPMSPLDPSAIDDVIGSVNKSLVEKLSLRGGWVTDHETEKARRSGPSLVRPVKNYRYVHFTRSTLKNGLTSAPFNVVTFITNEDPNYRVPGSIGDIDLPSRIKARMIEEIGRCSLEGMIHHFDEVRVVNPVKDREDKHKVIMISHLSHASHEESVTALDLISNEAQKRIATHYPELEKIGPKDLDPRESVERGIPIAGIYLHDPMKQEFDPEVLEYVRAAFFKHLIDPTYDFVSSDIDISHES